MTKETNFIIKNIKSLLFFFILFSISIALFYLGTRNKETYQWLLISPAFYPMESLNWVNSTWLGVLAIHGTIAALTISFIGIIINQISDSVESSFHSINRRIILKKLNFSNFSLNSILYLIYGIFFSAFGGGILTYFISMTLSIIFMSRYLRVFYLLYDIIENNERVSLIMLAEIELCTKEVNAIKDKSISEMNNLLGINAKHSNIHTHSSVTTATDQGKWHDIYIGNDKVIHELNYKKIKSLSKKLKKTDSHIDIIIDSSFLTKNARVRFSVPSNISINNESFDKIKNSVKACFKSNLISQHQIDYNELLDSTIRSIHSSLVSNNEKFIQFSLEAFIKLSTNRDIESNIKLLENLFYKNQKRNQINTFTMSDFFKELFTKTRNFENNDNGAALDFMLDYPYYSLNNDEFGEYFNRIEIYLYNKTTLGNHCAQYIKKYLYWLVSTLIHLDYNTFKHASRHLTERDFLVSPNNYERRRELAPIIIKAMKENIATLLNRLDYIYQSSSTNDSKKNTEQKEIISCIKQWIEPAFISKCYDIKEIYSSLLEPVHDNPNPLIDIYIRERGFNTGYVLPIYSFNDYSLALLLILNDKLSKIAQHAQNSYSEEEKENIVHFLNKTKTAMHSEFLRSVIISIIDISEIALNEKILEKEKVIDIVIN